MACRTRKAGAVVVRLCISKQRGMSYIRLRFDDSGVFQSQCSASRTVRLCNVSVQGATGRRRGAHFSTREGPRRRAPTRTAKQHYRLRPIRRRTGSGDRGCGGGRDQLVSLRFSKTPPRIASASQQGAIFLAAASPAFIGNKSAPFFSPRAAAAGDNLPPLPRRPLSAPLRIASPQGQHSVQRAALWLLIDRPTCSCGTPATPLWCRFSEPERPASCSGDKKPK
jgi:hypothetical protein